MSLYIPVIIFWIFCGLLASYIAEKRNRNRLAWFWIGFAGSLFGVALAFILPPLRKRKQQRNAPRPLPRPPEATLKTWFYITPSKETVGPLEFSELLNVWKKQTINEETYVWAEDLDSWKQICNLPELKALLPKQAASV